jgi:hypothetical protein
MLQTLKEYAPDAPFVQAERSELRQPLTREVPAQRER